MKPQVNDYNVPASKHFQEQMTRLTDQWPAAANDPNAQVRREREFLRVYEEVGGKRFEVAVDDCLKMHSKGFFPSLGEFYRYVPEGPVTEGKRCPLCKDSGGFQICIRPNPHDPRKTCQMAFKCKHDGLNLDGRIA